MVLPQEWISFGNTMLLVKPHYKLPGNIKVKTKLQNSIPAEETVETGKFPLYEPYLPLKLLPCN